MCACVCNEVVNEMLISPSTCVHYNAKDEQHKTRTMSCNRMKHVKLCYCGSRDNHDDLTKRTDVAGNLPMMLFQMTIYVVCEVSYWFLATKMVHSHMQWHHKQYHHKQLPFLTCLTSGTTYAMFIIEMIIISIM